MHCKNYDSENGREVDNDTSININKNIDTYHFEFFKSFGVRGIKRQLKDIDISIDKQSMIVKTTPKSILLKKKDPTFEKVLLSDIQGIKIKKYLDGWEIWAMIISAIAFVITMLSNEPLYSIGWIFICLISYFYGKKKKITIITKTGSNVTINIATTNGLDDFIRRINDIIRSI